MQQPSLPDIPAEIHTGSQEMDNKQRGSYITCVTCRPENLSAQSAPDCKASGGLSIDIYTPMPSFPMSKISIVQQNADPVQQNTAPVQQNPHVYHQYAVPMH